MYDNNKEDDDIFIMDEDQDYKNNNMSKTEKINEYYLDSVNLNNNYQLYNSNESIDSYYKPKEDDFFLSEIDDRDIEFEILSKSTIDYSDFSKTPESSDSYGKLSFMNNFYYYVNESANLIKTILLPDKKNNNQETT